MTYHERLTAFLVDHPDRIAATGKCQFCGAGMEDRINDTATDHEWIVVGEVEAIDHWARIDYLRDNDVSAYSKAIAHKHLMGQWPWQHNHVVKNPRNR